MSALLNVVRNMFPENVALAAVNMNILGIITFSLMFGLALASIGEAGDAIVSAVDVSLLCCLLRLVDILKRHRIAFECLIFLLVRS